MDNFDALKPKLLEPLFFTLDQLLMDTPFFLWGGGVAYGRGMILIFSSHVDWY